MPKHIFLRKKYLMLLLACTYSAFCNTAAANELDEFNLDTIVVTATRTPMEEKKIPQAVQVVTAEDIQNLGAANVTDALQLSTNINLSKAGMTGNQVSIRGMDTAHSLILIDGKRMAAEDANSTANVYELNRINVNDIERIEIVRGGSSALYGSEALGGVINIITKKSDIPKTTVGFNTGTEEMGTYFRYDSGKQGKLSISTAARLSDVRSQQSDTADSTNMHGPKRYFDFKADYDLGNNRGLSFDMSFLKEQLKEYYDDDLSAKTPIIDQKEWFDNNRSAYGLTYYGRDAKNDYKMRAYYNVLKKESRKQNNSVWKDFDHMKYETFVIDGSNSSKLTDQHLLTYGGEYRYNFARSTRMGGGGDNIYTDNYLGLSKTGSEKSLETYSAYLQDEWQVSNKFFVIPAVRYDYHSSFGSNVSPKLGMTYNLSDNARLKTNYGKSYRAPTISLLYYEMTRNMGKKTVEVLGNPNLQPEKSTAFDISFEAEKNNNWTKLTYFNNSVSNLITSETLLSTPTHTIARYINVDKAQINGVEAEFGRRFNKNWVAKATYNWLDAIDKNTHERLENRARNNGTIQLIYSDNAVNPLTATLWSEWNYDYRYDDKDYDYNTTNFVVNKHWNKTLSTYFGVNNIFDKNIDDLTVNGRTWRIGMEMTF